MNLFDNWRKFLTLVIILRSALNQIKVDGQDVKRSSSVPHSVSTATKETGINLADSFFLQKLREGNISALNDFNSLRQTLTIPENQQKAFTNILQQQHPFYRFIMGNMMQNALVHRFPNSHAIGPHQLFGNQQTFPLYQLLNMLSQNRGRGQDNKIKSQSERVSATNKNIATEIKGDEVSESPSTDVPFVTQSNFQKDQTFNDTVVQVQVGMLGKDRIKEVLKNKVHKNALNDTMKLIARLIKGRMGTNVRNINGGSMSSNSLKLADLPRDYLLQFVGNVLDRDVQDATDMSPRNKKFINQKITGKFWSMQTPENQRQKNKSSQFVGDIFGSGRFKAINPSFSDLAITEGNVNDTKQGTDEIKLQRVGQMLNRVTSNNVNSNTENNIFPTVPGKDFFLRFVGDLTGAKLISNRNGNKPALRRQSTDSDRTISVSDTAAQSQNQFDHSSATNKMIKSIQEPQPNRQIGTEANVTPTLNRDFVLQRVGNFLADQLTPVDGALLAFNATNTDVFTNGVTKTENKQDNNNMFERQNMLMWPKARNTQAFDRTNTFGRNMNTFLTSPRENSETALNSISNTLQNINQQSLTEENRNSVRWTGNTVSQETRHEDNTNAFFNSVGNTLVHNNDNNNNNISPPDITMIVDLLKSVTNETGLNEKSLPVPKATASEHNIQKDLSRSFLNQDQMLMRSHFLHDMIRQHNQLNTFGQPPFGNLARSGAQLFLLGPRNIHRSNLFGMGNNFHRMTIEPNSTQINSIPDSKETHSTLRTQTVAQRTEGQFQDNGFKSPHKEFVPDMKPKLSNPQRMSFQINGSNKTFVQGIGTKKSPGTGIETGFILVNRVFVTDDVNRKLDKRNKKDSEQGIDIVVKPETMAPQTGESVDMAASVLPSSGVIGSRKIAPNEAKTKNCQK